MAFWVGSLYLKRLRSKQGRVGILAGSESSWKLAIQRRPVGIIKVRKVLGKYLDRTIVQGFRKIQNNIGMY